MNVSEAQVELRRRHNLTPIQRALYASQQRAPRSPSQNMLHLCHIDGPVDSERFSDAFAAVVESSDALRTRILADELAGTSVELNDQPAITTVVDVERSEAVGWARDRVKEPLAISTIGYDSVLLRHGDGTVSWYLALHHCITDAFSSNLVLARTAAAYDGHPVETDSYYRWAQNAMTDSPTPKRAQRFWSDRPKAPRVGHLYERNLPPTSASTRLPVALDAELHEKIGVRFDREYRALTSDLAWTAALVTATAAYLHRVTGTNRLAIGVPIHNRSRPDSRDLIGPLVEIFPVDVDVYGEDTFADLQTRVSKSLQRTLGHAAAGTAPAGSDIEAVVNVVPELEKSTFAGHAVSTHWIHSGASDQNHLLRVQLTRYDEIALELDMNHAAAGPTSRRRAVEHFRRVLQAMMADPSSSVNGFGLLGDEELAVLDVWGHTPLEKAEEPIHVIDRLGSAIAERSDIALVDGDRSFTGTELWAWVSERAAHLASQGIGPGQRVAISMSRSAEAVVAIYATLLTGASYVPIDPAQPSARREKLIERAGCALVVESLPGFSGRSAEMPQGRHRSPDDEAYLLYTSGSTGEPKGVPICQRGLGDYIAFACEAYVDPNRPPIAPLFTALTFDLTVTTLFVPLLTGGRLHVMRDEGPAAIREIAATPGLTWAKATPSHLELLVRHNRSDHSLSTLIVGGEAFGRSLAEKIASRWPDLRMFNEYGPTETVVGCMIHEVTRGEFPLVPDVPIGRPAPGVRLRVADDAGQLVPLGVAGELWISSRGAAEGYIDGDNGAFVHECGRRWYRSGDLVRMLDDENLVYLRRIDEQLKVGGIRIDPAEIESVLRSHPAIGRVAVRAWTPEVQRPKHYCTRCGLADNVPAVSFDSDGVCDRCHAYDNVRDQAEAWFKTPDDLKELRDHARSARSGDIDAVVLLSGGKDSTYALFGMVNHGFKVHALTLDNGFISDEAKSNVRRSVEALGVSHEFATTDAMNEIFRDSLDRHSNVCHGCFKTIYTLGTTRAVELGAPLVVTGLSRGQLFETRLTPAQFEADRFDPDAIDAAVLAARRAYHRVDDAPGRLLDTDVFSDGTVFDKVRYVDFYRYVDVDLSEMLRFLEDEAPWVRPSDTGRSTNCRINAAGIATHLHEQGYHNYAEPYAWDVRLGHKSRDEALAELDDRDDESEVAAMLTAVGYAPTLRSTLTAWLELEPHAKEPSPSELRSFAQLVLPSHAIPEAFVVVDELAMTHNGKLDVTRLPAPVRTHRASPVPIVEPSTSLERKIVTRWERQLGVEPISIDDDYFALGGDSLGALEMTIILSEALGVEVADDALFANPTPRLLASALDSLDDRQDSSISGSRTVPSPGDGGEPPSLSPGERAMLFEYRRGWEDGRYHVGRMFSVQGSIDPERLRRAALRAIERHQPLHWTYSAPRRRLDPGEALAFEFGELKDWSAARAQASDLHRPLFDLEDGPLVRIGCHRVGAETAVTIVAHHVSIDAACFGQLWADIEGAYFGDELPALRIGYADHAAWQTRVRPDADAHFWDSAVGSVAPLAVAPPSGHEPDGVRERVAAIDPADLRSGGGAPPFVNVLTAVTAVLRGYMVDTDEVTIGAIVSTKDHELAEPLVGYFLNTLPLTIDVTGNPSLDELRDRSSAAFAAGLPHRSYPFAEMVAQRRRAGRPDPTPQVLVTIQEMHDVAFGQHRARPEVVHSNAAVADATFFVETRDDEVVLMIEYRGSAISASVADQMLVDLDCALFDTLRHTGALYDHPTGRSVLSSTSPRSGDVEHTTHVVSRIDEAAQRSGTDPAVICGGRITTWSELDRWSAATAQKLLEAGLERGSRVLVSMPRSAQLVAAIVGVLRAGMSYVPIDPTYPEDRNRLVIEASGAAAELVMKGNANDGVITPVTMPELNDVDPESSRSLSEVDLHDEAYVIFTSGSTGMPRGVAVTHRNLAVSTAARWDAYEDPPDRFLIVSSVAFDSSVAGLFWTLCAGGTVVMPTDDEVHDVDALLDLFTNLNVTHTLVVPSLYRGMLGRALPSTRLPDQVIVAGESCPAEIVRAHFARDEPGALTNEYGPTEATVWSTYSHLAPDSDPVPIGLPIAGTWVAVVDGRGLPRPSAVIGELVVGGPHVVGGYDDGSTERFAASSELGPGPVFFTGDRAAVIDGQIYFYGRVDEQLNLGGTRLEPGEIESILRGVDGVLDAVVIAHDDRPTRDQSLVAHLEIDGGEPMLGAIRDAVARALPTRARPSIYCRHEHLPRGSNGKLDREAARRLPLDNRLTQATPTADTGPLQVESAVVEMTQMFAQVLGRDDLASDESFFDAGGDSLAALELLASIEARHGLRPRVSILLDSPSPVELVHALGLGGSTASDDNEAVEIQRGTGTGTNLWMLPGGGGVPLIFAPLVERLGPAPMLRSVEYPGTRAECAPLRTVEALGEHCHRVITAAQPQGPYSILGYSIGGLVGLDVARRLRLEGHDVRFVGAIAAGLVDEPDQRSFAAKTAEAYHSGGGRYVFKRLRVQLGTRVRKAPDRIRRRTRLFLEDAIVERMGMRPSDQAALDAVKAASEAAGLAYRPDPVDVAVDVFLPADGTKRQRDGFVRAWKAVAMRGANIIEVSGTHDKNAMMVDPDQLSDLADAVRHSLGIEP